MILIVVCSYAAAATATDGDKEAGPGGETAAQRRGKLAAPDDRDSYWPALRTEAAVHGYGLVARRNLCLELLRIHFALAHIKCNMLR